MKSRFGLSLPNLSKKSQKDFLIFKYRKSNPIIGLRFVAETHTKRIKFTSQMFWKAEMYAKLNLFT